MKKKWIIAVVIALAVVLVITGISLLGKKLGFWKGAEAVSVMDNCWEHVSDMNVTEQEDGTVLVVLTAPDYASLAEKMAQSNSGMVTSAQIAQAVESDPEAVKEYTFVADSSEESDIKDALVEQIAYELVALTLVDMNG